VGSGLFWLVLILGWSDSVVFWWVLVGSGMVWWALVLWWVPWLVLVGSFGF
jgi:hypothetical protein